MQAVGFAAFVLAVAALCSTASADAIPVPYPIGSIPIYHHPTVPPIIPHDQLLFPSIPPYFPQKKVLPYILPRLLGSLPYQHPGSQDIAAILSNPLLDTVLPLSAEAPIPGTSEALAAESAPALAPKRSKSLIARKVSPRKHLQAQDRNRAAVLAALTALVPAPAPTLAEGLAPALGPIPSSSFNAFFASLNSQALAPAPALVAATPAEAPVVAPGVTVEAPGVSVVAPGVDVNVPLPQPTPLPTATPLP
ncbi:hypothetical protein COCOBI_14-0050 [Coccomyxa sp. Obi]|nr:hypothetical protein COCOBI_14-0050 [Coccomyxa sp. Obi]